ncbi:hypothetical protein [Simkania negevensis]|uniref:Uncharacterized protein n=1 Tax=Simkania negevensis (strain ATCC VR-1471 / DSM 27360 / Z) TaxID=331113 RepID=F8L6C7_SIMNZ|nr:hypothetical protein [Simkania negevensis]CCB88257.1 unknown protein [Simkania negevensis Z]
MSVYETPRPSRNFSPEIPERVLGEIQTDLTRLKDTSFSDLDEYQKQQVILSLYHNIKANQGFFTDLDPDDQYDILIYLFTYELEFISIRLETSTAQDFFKSLIQFSNLSSQQKIEIALQIMISHGKESIRKCDFLTHTEQVQASTQFHENASKVFPNDMVPDEIEEIRQFAFEHFSGPRKVPTSQHHYVLIGLLYANEPDIEAIKYVANKYFQEQYQHFTNFGFSRVVREVEIPSIRWDYSHYRPGRRTISALHPGGFYSSQYFLKDVISGIDIDDEEVGIQVFPLASVGDENLVRRAQQIAAQNMDFPAFLKISHIQTKEISYDQHSRECRIYSTVDLDEHDYEIIPLQPRVNSFARERLERLYSSEYADRIYHSLKNPIQIENPKDPVRRVLFPSSEEEKKPVSDKSPTIENDKHFMYFIFKCLLCLLIFKIGFQIFAYFRSKFSHE